MYGLLVSDPTQLNPNLRFMWSTYHCESAPEPTTPAAVQQITAILTQHQPALDPAARDRIRAELMALIPWVSDCSGELLEFVLLVALQHHSLPAGERAQREARISTVLTNHFGPPAGWTPDRAATLDGVRRTAVLTPDDLLNNHLRSVCGAMETVSAQARFKPTAVLTPAETAERDAQFKSDFASAGGQVTVYQALLLFYSHALPGERQQRRDRVNRIAASTKKMRLYEYIKSVSAAETSGPMVVRLDALWEALTALEEWMGQPDHDPRTDLSTELIDLAIARMQARQLAAERQAQSVTLAALRRGVNLGQLGRQSLLNAQAVDAWVLALSTNWTPALLKAGAATPAPATPRRLTLTVEPPREAARTWRTKRSLEIYKGPVARRRTPAQQTVNRAAARQQLQDRALKVRKPVQTKPPTVVDTWTDRDVDQLLRDTLLQSANFYLAEANDLIELARTLGAPEPAIHACTVVAESLVAIIKAEADDELQARDMFAQAEQAITDLRRQVTLAEAEARLRGRFDQCLTLALAREAMVHGKAHGGVIAQPLGPKDWSWVQARYHRRWLSGITRFTTEDGISTALPDDCALALHVTAKSLSGYAFDISVHLWYRQPDKSSAPSTSTDSYPPMNEDDWYDSFIPCTVLHIPHAT